MQHTTNSNKTRPEVGRRTFFDSRFFVVMKKKKTLLILCGIIVIILVVLLTGFLSDEKRSRADSYKKVSGAAGLQAIITYDVRCDKQPCDKKPSFDFNVYIYTENGQQIAVVQPDRNGHVNAALAEGEYIMLIGKQFGKNKLFPQEPLVLKNGQMLELKLHYK